MSFRPLALILGLSLLSGCSRSTDVATTEPAPSAEPAAPVTEGEAAPASAAPVDPAADMAAALAELTQAVRRYAAEKQKVPASLQEIVSAGYLPQLPQAPSGKRFTIDPKRLEVGLVGR